MAWASLTVIEVYVSDQSKTSEPWDRLPDETSQAYAAALAYFKLGPARSIDAVAVRRSGLRKGGTKVTKGGKAPGHVQRWCSAHRWVERAAAWDRNIADSEARAQHEAIQRLADQEAREWAEWRSTFAKTQRNVYTGAYQRYMEICDQHRKSKVPNSDVKPVSQAEFNEALKAVMLATDAGREALSIAAPLMPDSKGDQPQQIQPLSLSAAEAAAAMRAIVETRRDATSQENSQ